MKTIDELTALNLQAHRERTLANIARRASTLFFDGYHAMQTLQGGFVNCYVVTTPRGDKYTVKTTQTNAEPGTFYGPRCSCACFEKMLTCKHLQALQLQEAQEAAQCDEYEALYGDAAVDAAIGGRTVYGACRYSDY